MARDLPRPPSHASLASVGAGCTDRLQRSPSRGSGAATERTTSTRSHANVGWRRRHQPAFNDHQATPAWRDLATERTTSTRSHANVGWRRRHQPAFNDHQATPAWRNRDLQRPPSCLREGVPRSTPAWRNRDLQRPPSHASVTPPLAQAVMDRLQRSPSHADRSAGPDLTDRLPSASRADGTCLQRSAKPHQRGRSGHLTSLTAFNISVARDGTNLPSTISKATPAWTLTALPYFVARRSQATPAWRVRWRCAPPRVRRSSFRLRDPDLLISHAIA